MKSTLPTLEAERLSSGAVRLTRNGAPVFTFDWWRPDKPVRSSRLVYINRQYFQLRWAVAPTP